MQVLFENHHLALLKEGVLRGGKFVGISFEYRLLVRIIVVTRVLYHQSLFPAFKGTKIKKAVFQFKGQHTKQYFRPS